MVSLNWIILLQRAWIIVGIVLSTVLAAVLSSCPRDVSTRAHSCFTAYSFHFQNMQNSPLKLCCGVDVETLRAFCHSYMSAIECVKKLKQSCPKDTHHLIDNALVNLDGARAGLQELCSDDSIIESYAMYQSCFTMAGSGSEKCFQTYMNSSSNTNIRFLSKVSTKRMDQFCNEMRNTVECVQKNVQLTCRREEAARLAAILVKPMVRQSTECDYSVIDAQQQTTNRPYHGQHAYISDDHGGGKSRKSGSNNSGRNDGSDVRHAPYVTIMVATAMGAFFLYSGV